MNSRYADAGAMAAIKAATSSQHDALEARAGILARVETPQGYAALIAIFTALHDAYEPQIARYSALFDDLGLPLEPRSKRALLEADRIRIQSRFGIDVAAIKRGPMAFPRIETFAAAVGWLYVFEGSTLGGMLIAQHARHALAISTSYYGAYGARSAHMWRDFCAFVSAYVGRDPDALPPLIAAAGATFTLVEQTLTTSL